MINVIGEVVNYWAGGDCGGTAKILKTAYPRYRDGKYDLYDSLKEREGPFFLAKSVGGIHKERLVLLHPYLYSNDGQLEIKWEIVFNCWPEEGKNTVDVEIQLPYFKWSEDE